MNIMLNTNLGVFTFNMKRMQFYTYVFIFYRGSKYKNYQFCRRK